MFARTLSAFAAAALTLTAAAAATVASAEEMDTQSVVVRVDDLNLGNQAGLARLDNRLKVAARGVCDSGARDLKSLRLDAECRAKALAGARTEVAAIVSGRSGRTEVALRR